MTTITALNVNYALREGLWKLKTSGVRETSRNGDVIVMHDPVTTTYLKPDQRVLFNPIRDANPVFHLMEAIWMFAGRSDVEFLLPFNAQYANYSDDGYVHGAYGHRWRDHFLVGDQILGVIRVLKANKDSRQAVIAMWDPEAHDLEGSWKDRPCNTHIYFDCRGGRLNMTVCCRSNDMIWGAYGANVVHFSMLQEAVAFGVGVQMGVYRQFSNNFHIYPEVPVAKKLMDSMPDVFDYYSGVEAAQVFPLMSGSGSVDDFLGECEEFCDNSTAVYDNNFLTQVAQPLRAAYINRKAGDPDWRIFLKEIPARNDWKLAFNDWVLRREGVK